jgi:predicted Rdx family selenoprotein
MASEFYQAFGRDASVTISPRGQGIMEVFIDGERVFDKKGEGNIFPDLWRVRKMKEIIRARLKSLEAVAADD